MILVSPFTSQNNPSPTPSSPGKAALYPAPAPSVIGTYSVPTSRPYNPSPFNLYVPAPPSRFHTNYPAPSSSYNYYNNRHTLPPTPLPNAADGLSSLLLVGLIVSLIVVCVVGCGARSRLRREVLSKMLTFRQQEQGIRYTETDIAILKAQNERSLNAATGCCCCHPGDVVYRLESLDSPSQQHSIDNDDTHDLSKELFRFFLASCCGACCGCWWMCCGMCATRQEDREMELILQQENPKLLQVDYITFQFYDEYYDKILQVRNQGSMLWKDHFGALSSLSQLILKGIAVLWGLALLMSLITISSDLHSVAKLIIFVLTWGQAVLLLYFVYWRHHRLTISLDAVIKYFASGFVLSISMAILYEFMLVWVLGTAIGVVLIGEGIDPNKLQTQSGIHDLMREHLAEGAIASFFMAFVVAAMVEEFWKYYSYWMVETPDLMDQDDIIMDDVNNSGRCTNPSRVTRGSNITIAMVTVAVGFACAENLEYVFGQKSIEDELFVLVLRACLPVHPLCAAIQSIGVVRRDLEGDRTHQVGRIILWAVMLHGMFDFVAMLLAFVETAESDDIMIDDDVAALQPHEMSTQEFILNLESILCVLPVVVAGVFYYVVASRAQRRRLQEIEKDGSGDMLLVETMDNDKGTAAVVKTNDPGPSSAVDDGEYA